MNEDKHQKLLGAMSQFEEKPKVDEAAQAAGLDKVSAAERDAAWDAHQQQADQGDQPEQDGATATEDPGASPTDQGEDVEAIWVRTVPGVRRFRRAGMAFNEAGTGVALEALTDEQLAALEAEPNLIVERNTFTDNADSQG
ncbi:HI1506-related protein [Guyparkeria halophila]|uniref:HI1506-related protein n=1 Tax=Guyparkeria halophila TaxID=47960 RepID=A0ABZ0YVD3_9GAMM|nr:HI1506-related protein [Guyparkeria halophila]WQH16140.1 HI1506-related protein [Guyparkeria halophila]